ncbi:acyl-CoA desaturase [Prochlorothrix hollandica]|uniref:Delta 9 acyl-lipid fatty acid desaturase n=1 Tax=Prochlorothrix hollandica PCC 9006 = CALU 1027 TaxID=317619 RepID=A0A0M2PQ67_PROHO|nr:delta 9 acyl-lipid fatty acid desaturase [Prochlorothrix hollandica PCC 9006 = CALU 1027]
MRKFSTLTTIFYLMGPILIITSHFGSLLVLVTGLSWGSVAWIVWLYLIRMLGTTAIYHRLLTHKSYQVPALVAWLGSIITASAGQMGPSWWKAHHLAHHQYVEQDGDPHSPYVPAQGLKGFYWSQGGWILSSHFFPDKLPSDLEKDPVMRAIDRLHFVPTLALAGLSYGMGGLEYLAAFFLSTTLLFHGVQTVNSLSHLWGSQPFKTADQSRNNALVAFLTLGEGWHNLHHAFPFSCRQGITLKEGQVVYLIDPTFSFVKVLESLSLATKIRVPSEADLLGRAKDSPTPPPSSSMAAKTLVKS